MNAPATKPFTQDRKRPGDEDEPVSLMRQEYENQQALFHAQPVPVQRFLEAQARLIAAAIVQEVPQVKFLLPDRVLVSAPFTEGEQFLAVPARQREQIVGGLWTRMIHSGMQQALRQRFLELIQSPVQAVSISAVLLKHKTVLHIVCDMLPSGPPVTYVTGGGEEIPTIPVNGRFYLPQWVAFDEQGTMLVNSVKEAEACMTSMQQFLSILNSASFLAPYIVIDEAYQQKRYGMLGQLVNQGRSLAKYLTNEIIEKIQRRAQANNLNRGLSLSLPYFDDQDLAMKLWDFVVISAGRIGFVKGFVVGSALEEQAKAAQDARLSPSTRHYLLMQLRMLEFAFRHP